MKVIRSCALVILVLLVTVSANNGNEEIDLSEFEKGLSLESKDIFNSLNSQKQKLKYYSDKKTLQSAKDELSIVKEQKDTLQQQKDTLQQQKDTLQQQKDTLQQQKDTVDKENIELKDKIGYNLFACAVDNIKSNTEVIYPQYTDDSYKNYQLFTRGIAFKLPDSIVETIGAFFSIEKELRILSKHTAHIKIPRFFYDMHTFLTRFDDKAYKTFLLAESRGHAETIVGKITESKLNDGYQKEQAIVDFACRYARIRHGVNVYFHHFRSAISAKTTDVFENKRRAIKSQTNTQPDESQISVTLPEVLDHIGFLTAWNFTIDDITFMNIVSEIARPSNDKIYEPCYYDVKDGNGKTLKGVLPFANEIICPSIPRTTTTTGSK